MRRRCLEQVAGHAALERADLAIDGDDLMRALAMAPGPALGGLLDELLERVIGDPMLNERNRLLALAREIAASQEAGPSAAGPEAAGPGAGHAGIAGPEAAEPEAAGPETAL